MHEPWALALLFAPPWRRAGGEGPVGVTSRTLSAGRAKLPTGARSMARTKFDWRSSKWASVSEEEGDSWIKVLEHHGVKNVERTLDQTGGGSAATIPVGGIFMTQGLVEEWLAFKYAQKEEREVRFRWIWAVLVAVVA